MKQDMNKLIESFFARKENVINESFLEEAIRKQFKLLREESYTDMANKPVKKGYGKGSKSSKEMVVKYSFIPEISVSELGWSSLKTVDGVSVPSAQRQQLFDYLRNIQGNTFAEKVRSINSFYKKSPEQLERGGFFPSDSKSSKIQQIISYLVFLKTLTTIITNFNAAAAGFAFESFLGVLLEGTQVPTGSGTIADLTTGGKMGKVGISLKLYSESGVEVGGSFTDLSNDMINPKNPENPFIRYVIAIKSLKGKGTELSGEIGLFQFDINLDNIFDIMALASTHSRECIRLPKLFISGGGQTDFSHLKRKSRTDEEVKDFFQKRLSDVFQGQENQNFEQWSEALLKMHDVQGFWTGGKDGGLGKSKPNNKSLKNFLDSLVNQEILSKENSTQFFQQLMSIYKQCEDYAKGADLPTAVTSEGALRLYNLLTEAEAKKSRKPRKPPAEKEAVLADGVELASVEESVNFYNSADAEIKKKALLNSQGYIKTMQFSMTKNQLMSVISATKQEESGEIAKIEVGVVNVENIINGLASSINQQVFEIFDSLSLLTNNINSYFATGLKDDNAATTAQTAALNIDKKTEEIKAQSK